MMAEFRVREARRADAEAIGAFWYALMSHHHRLDPRVHVSREGQQQYIRHTLAMIRSRDARVLVAEDTATGTLLGYLMGELQSRSFAVNIGVYGFISDMFVLEARRHEGIGRALFEEMRRWFALRGANAIELYASVVNAESQGFWKAMGLEPFLTLMHLDLS
jgi:GNAT superfamily N-acetyltransferase